MAGYKLTNEAKDDLIRIYRYGTIKFGEAQAERYFSELFEKFALIAERPEQFQRVDEIKLGYRRCVYRSNTIYFKDSKPKVEIIAIVGSQDLGAKL